MTGGRCEGRWCDPQQQPGSDCLGIGALWQPEDVASGLTALTAVQLAGNPRSLYHNEFIVDGAFWAANFPRAIDVRTALLLFQLSLS